MAEGEEERWMERRWMSLRRRGWVAGARVEESWETMKVKDESQ